MGDLLNIVDLSIKSCHFCPDYNFTHNGNRDEEEFCENEFAPSGGFIIQPDGIIPDACPRLEYCDREKTDPIVILINGYPRSGKDTFCEIAYGEYYTINYSTVDTIKEIARQMGWDGEKTPHNRDMLSALKDFYVYWFDGSFKEITSIITEAKDAAEEHFVFIHAREPEEIERVKEWCIEEEVKVYTVFIERDVEKDHNNHADAHVEDYMYDIYISNNGTLDEFEEKSLDIFRRMIHNDL